MDNEEPALPPDPELLNRQPKWFKPVLYLCIGASALFAIALLFIAPTFGRGRHRHYDQTEAYSNARQISLALLEFDTDYGAYPDASTILLVEKQHGTSINLSGRSSNALFRQFFAAQITSSEAMFFAKRKDSRKPDGITTPGNILEPNSCGFSYISGLSSKDDPSTPIVLTPLIPGTTKFDPKPFKGKAVILHVDSSVISYDIEKDGRVLRHGIDILSPKNPVWKGKTPDIRYPE